MTESKSANARKNEDYSKANIMIKQTPTTKHLQNSTWHIVVVFWTFSWCKVTWGMLDTSIVLEN